MTTYSSKRGGHKSPPVLTQNSVTGAATGVFCGSSERYELGEYALERAKL